MQKYKRLSITWVVVASMAANTSGNVVANIAAIYIINYIILITILYVVVCSKRSSILLTEVSLSVYLSYINQYTGVKKIINIILLILGGLAPTSNFFFKMAVFMYLLKTSNIFLAFIFLSIIILNTTYYLQAIYVREYIAIDPAIIRKIMDNKDCKDMITNKYIF